MSGLRRKLIKYVAHNEGVWEKFNQYVYPIINEIRSEKFSKERTQFNDWISQQVVKHFPDLSVKRGPFRGMVYPDHCAFGSALFPKLLGTYEKELHEVFSHQNLEQYKMILDVGCAEGYYAVGIARSHPEAKVYAFDIDDAAIAFCQKMAALNRVENIVLKRECTEEELLAFSDKKKGLIIVDCEGYEKILLTKRVAEGLQMHDFLIEVHDIIDVEISGILKERFSQTHQLTIFTSVPESKKVYLYDQPELSGYSLDERKKLLTEHRREVMEWFYFKTKN